jgi:RHS repeat-associated protein
MLTYQFTGKERFAETASTSGGSNGLDNFGARYDSSSLGRFMSPDPDGLGSIRDDPQSWNMYAYARNNPLKYTDPDGMKYQICDNTNHCTEISDADFENNFQNANNVQLNGNQISIQDANGNFNKEGTFKRTSFDDLDSSANVVLFDLGRRAPAAEQMIYTFEKESIKQAVLGAVIGRVIGAVGEAVNAAKAGAEVPASTPVGRLGSPMNVAAGTNEGAVIGGRYYSGHALDSMQGRGLVPSVIEDTIGRGTVSPGNTAGTLKYTTEQAVVITNRAGDVVTAYPK